MAEDRRHDAHGAGRLGITSRALSAVAASTSVFRAGVVQERSERVYREDVDGLRLAQALRLTEEHAQSSDVSVAGDRAGIQMRRILSQLSRIGDAR